MVGQHHQLDGYEFEQLQELVIDREDWHAAVHGVTKSWTRLSDWTEQNILFISSLNCQVYDLSLVAQLVKNPPATQETPVQFLGQEDPLEKGQATHSSILRLPFVQLVKNLLAMWETWIQSLGWEDPLEKGKATHSSILAWRIPWTPMGLQRVGHNWSNFHFTPHDSLRQFYYP